MGNWAKQMHTHTTHRQLQNCTGMSTFWSNLLGTLLTHLKLVTIILTKTQEAKVGYAKLRKRVAISKCANTICKIGCNSVNVFTQVVPKSNRLSQHQTGCPKIRQVCLKIDQTVPCCVLSCISGSTVVCGDCCASTYAPVFTG